MKQNSTKHAFLLMAHNEKELLFKLLHCLDDYRNDIYIHLDKRFTDVEESEIHNQVEMSQIYFIQREFIYWSGYSQVDCELRLLQAAIKESYRYYHFISGVDLPLKSPDEFHRFFEKHDGQEFVEALPVNTWKLRTRYKYLHSEKLNNRLPRSISRSVRYPLAFLQSLFFINQVRGSGYKNFYWGSSWFSITDGFAQYVLDKKDEIQKMYKFGFFVDEVFLATLLMNSKFKDRKSSLSNLRLINWERGRPYVWTANEFEEIMNSSAIFCRKFSLKKDRKIVHKIMQAILGKRIDDLKTSRKGELSESRAAILQDVIDSNSENH